MNIGAGRIILQDILRIDEGFKNGSIEQNNSLVEIKEKCKRIHMWTSFGWRGSRAPRAFI